MPTAVPVVAVRANGARTTAVTTMTSVTLGAGDGTTSVTPAEGGAAAPSECDGRYAT